MSDEYCPIEECNAELGFNEGCPVCDAHWEKLVEAADRDRRGLQLVAERRILAKWACSFDAPCLTADATRGEVLAWLEWNDPDGMYTDSALRGESTPMPLGAAWAHVNDQYAEHELGEEPRYAEEWGNRYGWF